MRGDGAGEITAWFRLELVKLAVDRHFESEPVRVFFKTLLHVITADNVPGTGLLFISLLASFTRQALPLGGAASFPRALASLALGIGIALLGLVVPPLRWLYDYAWFVGFFVSGATYFVAMRSVETMVREVAAGEQHGD